MDESSAAWMAVLTIIVVVSCGAAVYFAAAAERAESEARRCVSDVRWALAPLASERSQAGRRIAGKILERLKSRGWQG